MKNIFLQAEWRKLIMANYAFDSERLKPYLPHKTELDLWNGVCYVSLIGFMFMDTKVKGFKIPFHTNFEEVNLRFYVRFRDNGLWKRGTVFIKEIVPKSALTWVANTVYKEKYETMPMSHTWRQADGQQLVQYNWKKTQWNSLQVRTGLGLKEIQASSEEEFITEHYWGYTRINDQTTSEYGVEHPRWQVYETLDYTVDVNFSDIYGPHFATLQDLKPQSVFLAEGSAIQVKEGRRI